MKLKKLAATAMAAALAASMVAGCGNGDNKADSSKEKNTNTESADSGEQITIRLASWSLGTEGEQNIDRRMIEAYEEMHSNINIEIATDIDTADWNGSLETAAAGGNLPDVVMIAEVPTAVAHEWVLDVSSYTENDEDWNNIPEALRESAKYGSGIYGVPYAMNIQGVYMNVDLFEAKNQELLTYGYTFDDFMNALKNLSAPTEGMIGIKSYDIVDWYPAAMDSNYGWFTYADGHVSLTDPLFIEGVKKAKSIYDNGYSFNALSDDQKANFGTDSDWEAFNAGKIAMAVDPTSNAGVFTENSLNLKFTSLPNGKCVIIPDYMFISQTCEHPQEAYDFLKFMSFGKEGILKRLELVEAEEGLNWVSLPLNTDSEIIDRYFANYPIEGVREVYENMEGNAFVEAFKYAPGYANARWNAPTGIKAADTDNANIAQVINACMTGELNIDDYAEQLNKLSNESINEIQAVIDEAVQ